MTWHWVLASTDGDDLADMTGARSRRVTFRLDGPSETQFGLSGRDPHAGEVGDGLDRDVKVYRDGSLLFRGRLSSPEDDVGETEHSVSCQAVSYRGVLERRIVWTEQDFTTTEQEAIAWGLIDHSQSQTGGDLGITREGTATGVTRSRTYAPGKQVAKAIDDLAGSDDGFEWDITPDHVFTVWPERGETVGSLVYGADVAKVSRRVDASRFANAHRFSSGELTAETRYTAAPEGRWERQTGVDADSQTELGEVADGVHADEAQVLPTWQVTLRPGRWPDQWLGDTCLLVVRSGRLDVAVSVRVVEIAVDVDEQDVETVTLTLGRPALDLAGEFGSLRQRLVDLERR